MKKVLRVVLGLALIGGIAFGAANANVQQQADPGGGGTGGNIHS